THPVIDTVSSSPGEIHAGRILSGMRAAVLDRAGKPVPHGVVGVLYADAASWCAVAAERPRASPVGFVATGFIARRRSNGEVELRGRRDDWISGADEAVHLPDLQELLLRIPGVEECAFDTRDRSGVVACVSVSEEAALEKARDVVV